MPQTALMFGAKNRVFIFFVRGVYTVRTMLNRRVMNIAVRIEMHIAMAMFDRYFWK